MDINNPETTQATSTPALEISAEDSNQLRQLEHALAQVFMGQREVIRGVLTGLFAAGHVLIEGVPGLGKTLLVRALSRAVGGKFGRVQFTPDLMPSDVTGHALYDLKSQEFRVRRGPVFCNLLLADEINRSPAKTQAALLEVMQEQQVTIEGKSFVLEPPFMVLATQNPIEQEGTYPLPEAQVDRFLLKVRIDYPNAENEAEIVKYATANVGDQLNVEPVQQQLSREQVLAWQARTTKVAVDKAVLDYAVRVAQATRSWNGIQIGAGPRASIAMVRAGRAFAVLNGRMFVTPDDIKSVAPLVLRHRVNLTPDMEIEGRRVDDVLAQLLDQVQAPRQ